LGTGEAYFVFRTIHLSTDKELFVCRPQGSSLRHRCHRHHVQDSKRLCTEETANRRIPTLLQHLLAFSKRAGNDASLYQRESRLGGCILDPLEFLNLVRRRILDIESSTPNIQNQHDL